MTDRDGILEFPCGIERLASGNTLIADAGDEAGGGSEVLEVDPDGRVVWRYGEGLLFAHGVRRLPDGRTLIADTTNNRVIEVDLSGRLVFTSDAWGSGTGRLSDGSHLAYPNHVEALRDGHLLITDRNNNRVVAVDRAGRIGQAWREGLKHPHSGTLLADGRLLVTDSEGNAVIEFDRDGRPAGRLAAVPPDGLAWPRGAARLPNGNTLITDSKHSRVVEVSAAGAIVWQFAVDYFANFYEAARLANGNTLIAGQQHQEVIEVSPTGAVVWRFRNYTRPTPIYPHLVNGAFREGDSDGRPHAWTLATRFSEGGGQLIWGRGPEGQRVPGLTYDRNGALTLQQTVAVEPGRRYLVEALLRAEGVAGVAFVQLAFLDAQNGLICDVTKAPRSRALVGDRPWSHESFETVAPGRATAADVRLFITGPGRMWVSEIRLQVQ